MRLAAWLLCGLLAGCATGQATGVACRDYPVAPHSGFSIWPWMWPVDAFVILGETGYRKVAAYRECAQEAPPSGNP